MRMWMARIVTVLAIVSVGAASFVAAQQTPAGTQLAQARARMAAGDLQGAAEGFEKVVAEFAPADRNAAANALVELGGIAELLGQTSRARAHYTRTRDEFRDQRTEAQLAAQRLAGLEGPAKIVIRTMNTDDPYGFAISPDGRMLVYQGISPDGKRQLWRTAVDASAKPEPIGGTEGAAVNAHPFFSPDGKSIAYFAGQKLWRVDLAGGAPVELAAAPSANGGSWSPRGAIVLSLRGLRSPLEKLEDGRLTAVTAAGLLVQPRFLDDQHFLYFARSGGGGTLQVGAIDGQPAAARGLPATVHAAAFGNGFFFYATTAGSLHAMRFDPQNLAASGPTLLVSDRVGREGRFAGQAAFSVSASGSVAYREAAVARRQMMWMNRAGDILGVIGTSDEAGPALPRVSPDGRFVLFFRQTGSPYGSVWLAEAATGAMRQLHNTANSPVWSPAGDRFLLSVLRAATGDVLLTEVPLGNAIGDPPGARGAAPALNGPVIGPPTGNALADDWNKNGFIVYRTGFAGGGGGTGDLFVQPPNGGSPIPVAASPAIERSARFSPDGNWIAYQSDESGRFEVYVQPFPGGMSQRQRVSLGGGINPQWGRGGRELYFLAPDGRLMAAESSVSAAERPSIEFKTPRTLIAAPFPYGSEYDTVDGGDRFLILMPVEGTPPIVVLPNWTMGK